MLCKFTTDTIQLFFFRIFAAKVAIIGEIWKSRAKLLKNRLFEKIASAGKATQLCPFWPRKICPPFCTI